MIFVYIISLVILVVVPSIFIYHHVYQDGIVGRAALSVIALVSSLVLYDVATGAEYEPHFSTIAIIAAFALFMCWHLFSFHTRIAKKQHRRADDPQNVRYTS